MVTGAHYAISPRHSEFFQNGFLVAVIFEANRNLQAYLDFVKNSLKFEQQYRIFLKNRLLCVFLFNFYSILIPNVGFAPYSIWSVYSSKKCKKIKC